MRGIFLFLFFFSLNLNASELVRVRLFSINTQTQVSGLGVVFEADKNAYKKVGLPRLNSFNVTFNKNSWKIKDGDFEKTIKSPYLAIEGSFLRVQSSFVPEKIFLWPQGNKIEVIGVLKLDEYLLGVLPHEMPASWDVEALKAQAVVARSFTLSKVKERRDKSYHLDSTVNDQVYKNPEGLDRQYYNKIKNIIRETQDLVLKNESGSAVRALYHADCGGVTEKSSNVWGQQEVEFSVKDPHCPNNIYSEWVYRIDKNNLFRKLGVRFQESESSLKPILGSDSKRVRYLNISYHGQVTRISSQELRKAIGYGKIKSTFFDVTELDGDIVFKGRGFGHGVGLCQWGAKSWAEKGKDYKSILKHYFPNYKVSKI